MKKILILAIAGMGNYYAYTQPPPQRIFFSSGAGSNSSMPVAIGEPLYGQGGGARVGSQQNTNKQSVGIMEMGNAKDRIALYPNPANNQINVLVQGLNQENFSIVIFDMIGNEVINKKNLKLSASISLETLPVGNYNVAVFSNERKLIFSQIISKQ